MNSPDRLAKIEGLFHAALEREQEDRAAFLAEACTDDSSLLDAVIDLLAAHDQSSSESSRLRSASALISAPSRRTSADSQSHVSMTMTAASDPHALL